MDKPKAPPFVNAFFSGDRPATRAGGLTTSCTHSDEVPMYEGLAKRIDPLARLKPATRDLLLDHTGDHKGFLRMHEKHAQLVNLGSEDVGPILNRLSGRFADARMMFCAAEDLRRAHSAPGPNGRRLECLSRSELWAMCRELAKSLREQNYVPGPQRKVKIPKGDGRGYREIRLQNVEDRVVHRALLLTLQPFIDSQFSPFSFGFRPQVGVMNALATGLALARSRKSWFWVTADVANAFDAIPACRFLDACRQYLPADIVSMIHVIYSRAGKFRLSQGSPSAPFFANLNFHHYLDRPFYRRNPCHPLLRYADDLALLTGSRDEAEHLSGQLTVLARSSGTPLKPNADGPICDIRGGQKLTWLGYTIRREGTRLTIRISAHAWSNLTEAFTESHLHSASPLRALQVVNGWINSASPCFGFENLADVAKEIRARGVAAAFEELPSVDELVATMRRGLNRWKRLYAREEQQLNHRLEGIGSLA